MLRTSHHPENSSPTQDAMNGQRRARNGEPLTPCPLRGANIGCDVVRRTIFAGPRPDVPRPCEGEGEPGGCWDTCIACEGEGESGWGSEREGERPATSSVPRISG